MSIRGQLFDLLGKLPGGNPLARILAAADHLSKLSPGEAEVTERRMLALAMVMSDPANIDPKETLDAFFARVDKVEATLVN